MIILRQKEYTSLPRKIGAKIARLRVVNAADRLGNNLTKRDKIPSRRRSR